MAYREFRDRGGEMIYVLVGLPAFPWCDLNDKERAPYIAQFDRVRRRSPEFGIRVEDAFRPQPVSAESMIVPATRPAA